MIRYNIAVVGCGGTGGRLIPWLAQYIAYADKSNTEINLMLIDGDHVENKNLANQIWEEEDIGMPKSSVLASILEDKYDLNILAMTRYIDKPEDIESIFDQMPSSYYSGNQYINSTVHLLIGCSDNHRARQDMEIGFEKMYKRHYSSNHMFIYMDSGNEFSGGEIVTGVAHKGKLLSATRKDFYPEIMTDNGKRASELSCEELNSSSPQHICTNIHAAAIMLATITDMIENGHVEGNIIYFDSFSHSVVAREYVDRKAGEES